MPQARVGGREGVPARIAGWSSWLGRESGMGRFSGVEDAVVGTAAVLSSYHCHDGVREVAMERRSTTAIGVVWTGSYDRPDAQTSWHGRGQSHVIADCIPNGNLCLVHSKTIQPDATDITGFCP